MRPLLSIPCLILCVWGLLSPQRASAQEAHALAPACGKGVIFVADGSGDLDDTFNNLSEVVREAGLPLCVQRVAWSHGKFRPIADLLKHDHHRDQGQLLAGCVLAHRDANPHDRIILVGHSAGAAVVLAAAESLPAGCLDRIVLLAPAVSAGYDLGPALRCARDGVDSFYSPFDGVLSTFVLLVGNADHRWEPAGGWLGFAAPSGCCCAGEECLSARLRQHPWDRSLWKIGHRGGHYGGCSAGHLRERVLPLLCAVVPAAPPARPARVSAKPPAPPEERMLRPISEAASPADPLPPTRRPVGTCQVTGFQHQRLP